MEENLSPLILVVEDDPDIREALTVLLEVHGFEVEQAANGREALDALGSDGSAPCLILLDLMMPVMDGREFLGRKAELRAPASQVPVVVVSAAHRPSLPPGIPLVAKPYEPAALMEVVLNHCAR